MHNVHYKTICISSIYNLYDIPSLLIYMYGISELEYIENIEREYLSINI